MVCSHDPCSACFKLCFFIFYLLQHSSREPERDRERSRDRDRDWDRERHHRDDRERDRDRGDRDRESYRSHDRDRLVIAANFFCVFNDLDFLFW